MTWSSSISKILCKKDFCEQYFNRETISFKKGYCYFYWINFNGMNHIVSDKEYTNNDKKLFPFSGTEELGRAYIWDYFYTIEETRNILINKIIT